MATKAQIRMTETIAILFIFFILVALGISFYAKYRAVSIKDQQADFLQQKAIRTTLRALFLPELICSRGTAEVEENCIDMLKARHLQEITTKKKDNREYYFDLFSYATITIQQLYPEQATTLLYHYTPADWEQKETTYFVVALRDEKAGERGVPRYGFGYLQIDTYSGSSS